MKVLHSKDECAPDADNVAFYMYVKGIILNSSKVAIVVDLDDWSNEQIKTQRVN